MLSRTIRRTTRGIAPVMGRWVHEGRIETHEVPHERDVFPPPVLEPPAHISSQEEYLAKHAQSLEDPHGFWGDAAASYEWDRKWSSVMDCDLSEGRIGWFLDAKLNMSVNCLDRHVSGGNGDAPALTWEADDGESRTYSYSEVLEQVCRIANSLRARGVQKGDRVVVLMPMVPELMFSVLACARIGAVHSVVFAGFSAEAVSDRIVDCGANVVMTTDAGVRGGKQVPLKSVMDEALEKAGERGANVHTCFVTHRAGEGVGEGVDGWVDGRDVDLHTAMQSQPTQCTPESMDAEDPLFILYTSGSTGKPKGVLHTQAGYMVYIGETFRYLFDHHPDAGMVHFCTADLGWITGHSYITYGPLLNGAHTVMFEGTPTYPGPDRLWEIVAKHRVTSLYTSPTALRSLMVFGEEPLSGHDLSSLRVLGTVGEPINPEAWLWYHKHVGGSATPIIDTWWQTETGGVLASPFPGATHAHPGSAGWPFFGVDMRVVDEGGEEVEQGEGGFLTIAQAWPGMMRTVYGDHQRFVDTYLTQFPGKYTTGDAAKIDSDGNVFILGRTDDVINVSGHRLSSEELESALVEHEDVVEAAVVGFPHDIKGEGLYGFVTLRADVPSSNHPTITQELTSLTRSIIGRHATPDAIQITPQLPKTRSGKIMRRILRKIAAGDLEDLGDTSTLAEPQVVESLVQHAIKV